MVVLTIEVNVGGQVRELQLMAARFGDLLPVMGPFSAYMRKQIDEGFETQGNGTWPDRKDSTQKAYNRTKEGRIAKVEANKFRGLQNRLRAELKRTSRPVEAAGGMDAYAAMDPKAAARRAKSIARKQAQAAEVARIASGGAFQPKGQKALYQRVERRITQAENRKAAIERGEVLGRIANSFQIKFSRKNWEMFSVIPWASVHNEGGRAANGAVIPKRTFLEWTDERLDVFVEMSARYLAGKTEAGRT